MMCIMRISLDFYQLVLGVLLLDPMVVRDSRHCSFAEWWISGTSLGIPVKPAGLPACQIVVIWLD